MVLPIKCSIPMHVFAPAVFSQFVSQVDAEDDYSMICLG